MYQIVIKKKAKKFIDRLPLNEKKRVVAAIERLPNGEDIKKLKGHADLLRLRVGEYRIIYTVDHGELIVMVIDADNRFITDIDRQRPQGKFPLRPLSLFYVPRTIRWIIHGTVQYFNPTFGVA